MMQNKKCISIDQSCDIQLSDVCSDAQILELKIGENITLHVIDDLMNNDDIIFILSKNAVLRYVLFLMNELDGQKREKTITVKLVGTHADAQMRCICKSLGTSITKLQTIQHHCASYTKSNLLIKGAFLQASSFFCDTLVKVEKKLKQVTVFQMNKNLLMGCNASIISVPKLEVESDDVQCKHGATVAQLNSEHIFYLQSRGICFCDSKKLLIKSFLR
jgi:Fe-S cluster assembly protein SufD